MAMYNDAILTNKASMHVRHVMILVGTLLTFSLFSQSALAAMTSNPDTVASTRAYGDRGVAFSQLDEQSGAFTYTYDLELPPGRNGMQPALALSYNSNNLKEGSLVGYGWSLSLPIIERINKDGIEGMYTDTAFATTLVGEIVPQVVDGNGIGTYLPRVATPEYFTFGRLSSGGWEAIDSKGTVYTFGVSSPARMTDPNNSAHVYRWYLESMQDANGNGVEYTYTVDNNQVYPSTIRYTTHGTNDGVFEVNFFLEARSDVVTAHESGFAVTTDSRIARIEIEVNNVLRKKFNLAYVAGSNEERSLLNSIVTTAYDELNIATVLPAFSLNYSARDWRYQELQDFTDPVLSSQVTEGQYRFADINGDGYIDILRSLQSSGFVTNWMAEDVWLGKDGVWTEDTVWDLPVPFTDRTANGTEYDQCAQLIDVNGDGLADEVYKNSSNWYDLNGQLYQDGVYINNGSGWTLDASWTIPLDICNGDSDIGTRFVELNGDGLVDIVQSYYDSNLSVIVDGVYLHNGSGWSQDTNWDVPVKLTEANGFDGGARVADVNGDGFADIVVSIVRDVDGNAQNLNFGGVYVDEAVYLNTGSGWVEDVNWDIPASAHEKFTFAVDWQYALNFPREDYGTRFADINGDGLVDLIDLDAENGNNRIGRVAINTGHGWQENTDIVLDHRPFNTSNCLGANPVQKTLIMDVNNDGIDDFVSDGETCVSNNEVRSFISTGVGGGSLSTEESEDHRVPMDLLEGIALPTGGEIEIGYNPASNHINGAGAELSPDLFFPKTVMRVMSWKDGLGNNAIHEYDYEGGQIYYDANALEDTRFAGFGKITATRPDGATTTRYFHQGNGSDTASYEGADSYERIGLKYREEVRNASGALMEIISTPWDQAVIAGNAKFVSPASELHLGYDGDADHRDSATEYDHDAATGMLLEQRFLGEVSGNDNGTYADIGTDSITTEYEYATHASGLVRGAVESESVYNHFSVLEKLTNYYYDSLSLGSVDKGNLTKKQDWISGSDYADTEMTYSSQGLVLTVEDAEDSLTTYTYNATHPLQPLTETNHLNQVASYAYDLATGKVTQKTMPNTSIFQTTYDGLGRPLTEKQSSPTVAATLETVVTYAYNNSSVPHSVHETRYLDGSTTVDTYAYVDGLGRPVQVRKEHETSNHYSVNDTIYDGLGRAQKISLPYDSAGSAYTSPTTTADLLETYTYDALDRVTSVANAAGTTISSYDQWVTTEFDANNEEKEYTYDARGLLVSVQENSGSLDFITSYQYSTLGNLTRFTDSWGHLRNFTYDKLGRRLTAEDLHASTDTAFGTWSYTYDKVGNMLTTTDANGKVITNTYDDLHRILTENDPAVAGTEFTYTYDTGCTNGVSQLCLATGNNGVITDYDYDLLGRATSVAQTVDAVTRTTANAYNRRGDILQITHPNNSKQEFVYGTAGRIASANWRTLSGSFKALLTSATYAPTGSPETVTLANGVVTTYDYDETELYRLYNKKSVKGATEFQDFTYTYDGVGNITNIADTQTIYPQVTHVLAYDDLHRLTSAVATSTSGAYAGTRNFAYNQIGNLTSMTGTGSYSYNHAGAGVYANPHAPTTVGTKTLTYDKNGNLLTDGTWTNTWDYKNRMITSAKTGNTVSYLYDHTGRRVKKTDTTTAVPTYYVDGSYEIEGSRMQHHVTVPGIGLLATVTSTTINTYAYHLTDHLGSPHLETNATGAWTRLQVYEPYGKIRYQTGSYTTDYKFTGKEQDTETSLQYFGARYYDNTRGQFTSQDALFRDLGDAGAIASLVGGDGSSMTNLLADPQLWNSYAYARSNPLTNYDPTGNVVETVLDVVSTVLSARAFYLNPTPWNAIFLGLDGLGTAVPVVPSGVGYARHGVQAIRVMNYFNKVSSRTGKSAVYVAKLYSANTFFNFSRRAWSAGTAGDSLGSLVGHFALHGSEVGAKNVRQYYDMANDFLGKKHYTHIFKEGPDTVYFNRKTRESLVTGSGGEIKTYLVEGNANKISGYEARIRKGNYE